MPVTIHRFDFAASEERHEVITHDGAQFLHHVMPSDRVPGGFTLWATVPVPLGPVQTRHVRVVGTGDTADLSAWTHLGTYRDLGYGWHVFADAPRASGGIVRSSNILVGELGPETITPLRYGSQLEGRRE